MKAGNPKTPNSGYVFNDDLKCFTSWVICVNSFIMYVYHHNGITQRPIDHLFEKSDILVKYVP